MKICSKLIDSIKKRGMKRTIQLIYGYFGNYVFDLRYGTNTAEIVMLDNLDILSVNKNRGTWAESTQEGNFRKLFDKLNFPKDSVFVDLGSGKGKSLMLASRYNFKKVIGVEFSYELCEIARRNISIFQRKEGIEKEVVIIESDVVEERTWI